MRVLLFSSDEYFLNVFACFLSKEKLEFDLFSYSEEEEAVRKLEKERFDLILCEEGYLDSYEEETGYISLGMHTVYPSEKQRGRLNIYQSASRVKEELEYMIQVLGGKELKEGKENATLVSFFSTEGGSGKTTLAYLTAVECAKNKKTMYMNLEPLAVTDFLYAAEWENSMEEILLSFDGEKEEMNSLLLNTMKKSADDVYVIPVLNNIGDYLELSAAGVLQMVRTIANLGGMEVVILDLPGAFSAFTENLLLESKKIVWVYNDGRTGKKKLEKVQSDPYLKAQGILSKSCYVLNRCTNQESCSEYHAAFPVSNTLSTAGQISRILEVNEAFQRGCQNIVHKISAL